MPRLSLETISPTVKKASYAVRGAIVKRSQEISAELKNGDSKPFKKVVACNIGNPQALQQQPMSFLRDVTSLVTNPGLIDRVPEGVFKDDVVDRARRYLYGPGGATSMGSYSESKGILAIREDVAKFLEQRDGFPADSGKIFLTNGASEGVRVCMQTIMRPVSAGFNDGVLTPIPQYPLYSALTALLDGHLVPYYLDEKRGWACTKDMLEKSLSEASDKEIDTRCLVVINPGNPTGQVLPLDVMQEIVQFCHENDIVLMADEVYQENIWKTGAKFYSFRKVAYDMGLLKESNGLQLISFHSISKGFLGECGLRGGFFELNGIDSDVADQIYKLASISLCSNTVGQVAVGVMVQPPKEGEPSFPAYKEEKDSILNSLKRRAVKMNECLNSLDGVECTESEGALYAFPTINLPPKAISAAEAAGIAPDAYYCNSLLENTGIVTVPGSGFKQLPGTNHYRITILPPEDEMDGVFERLSVFHKKFMDDHA